MLTLSEWSFKFVGRLHKLFGHPVTSSPTLLASMGTTSQPPPRKLTERKSFKNWAENQVRFISSFFGGHLSGSTLVFGGVIHVG